MRKSLLILAAASSLAFAPAAFAAEREARAPAPVRAEYVAPTPQTVDRSTLAQAHGVATPADQTKTAGRIPLTIILIGTVVIVTVIAVSG